MVLALVISVGAVGAWETISRHRHGKTCSVLLLVAATVIPPPAIYAAAPLLLDRLHVDVTGARRCPDRDNNWYFLYPPKRGDFGPRNYAEAALAAVGPNGVLVADYTLWRPLGFVQQVENIRPDVELQLIDLIGTGDELVRWIGRTVADRPVYFASDEPRADHDLDAVERVFTLTPRGKIFQLLPKPTASPTIIPSIRGPRIRSP